MRDKPARGRTFRIFPPSPAAEVDDELAFHIEERVREYVARGMDPESARAAAIARLGDLNTVRQECTQMLDDDRRAAQRRDWLDDLRQDLRYGVRSALRSPLFTMLAIVTLALGIGANAAVFGVVKSVLLDALPYRDADLWFTLNLAPMLRDPATARGQHWLGIVARLAPGVEPSGVQRELDRLEADLARAYPKSDVGRTFVAVPLRTAMVGDTRTPLLVLMASAITMLSVRCGRSRCRTFRRTRISRSIPGPWSLRSSPRYAPAVRSASRRPSPPDAGSHRERCARKRAARVKAGAPDSCAASSWPRRSRSP